MIFKKLFLAPSIFALGKKWNELLYVKFLTIVIFLEIFHFDRLIKISSSILKSVEKQT